MWKVFRKAKNAIQFLSWEAIQIWVLPSLSVPATVLIGWLQGIPWFYVYIAAGFMFASVTIGILRLDEWKSRRTAKDKLSFSHVRIATEVSEYGYIDSIGLGFQLTNLASFPMQFDVDEINSELMGLYPPKKNFEKTSVVIPANGIGWFCDHCIKLDEVPTEPRIMEGILSVNIKYGRRATLINI